MKLLDLLDKLYAKTRKDPLEDYEKITIEDHQFLQEVHHEWPKLSKRIKQLLEAEAHLDHLKANGVDNWEGYSHPGDDEDET